MVNTRKNNQNRTISANPKTSPLIRGLDLIISGGALVLLTPIFLIMGLLIKLTSPGPVFYQEERIGKDGRIFKLYKFRTALSSDNRSKSEIPMKGEQHKTKIGSFLQHTNLEESLQFINVLRGEMSLIGPQPQCPSARAYSLEQRPILAVKPGLTSPAALYWREMRQHSNKDTWEKMYQEQVLPHGAALDLNYLQQRTIWTDFVLILKTILIFIHAKEASKAILRARNRHFFALDMIVLLLTPAIALTLRLDSLNWWMYMRSALVFYTLISISIKLAIFYKLGLYRRFWRYAGVNDLARTGIAVGLSTLILTILFFSSHAILRPYNLAMYRFMPLIDGLLTLLSISGSRLGIRGLYHWYRQAHEKVINGRRVLIAGAGEAGGMIVREIRANPQLNMEAVVFADDDPAKLHHHIQGIPVMGSIRDIPKLVEQFQIQRIIVAIPSAPLGRHHEIMAICQQTGITTHSLPGVYEILAGYKTVSHIPRFEISRLLRREPIETDQIAVRDTLAGACVLITGAGGSIGSELCRQIARCVPRELVLLGHGENSIFEINLDLRLSFPNLATHSVIVDVRDQQRVAQVIQKYRPDIIFHAAAHKHVPFMETHVEEAFTNNVLGTRNVLQAAENYNVERFVLISTDKAVNPTSIMGATKRLAELLVIAAAQRSGNSYMAVRFGNVLGSRGSVLRVFQQQIAAGGPLTITHPDMYRYFMTIPEAVQLVLQAAVLGKGGEAFVLDMGQPVRILDMATDLVKLCGLEPGRDIEIVCTGIRPGEKLNEELFLAQEDYQRTRHPKIYAATQREAIEPKVLEQVVTELTYLTSQMKNHNNVERMLTLLPKICYYIDKYQPGSNKPPLSGSTSASKSAAPHPHQAQPFVSTARA
jgi:FlaA1/EpsC-like NDP-sugar epimerase/lipopolysaccharide/colanic/teichoic acid biosynthesis glycosyltransferase